MEKFTLYKSKKVVLEDKIDEAGLIVDENGKISKILTGSSLKNYDLTSLKVTDFGDLVLMPGVVDSHVHVNEPGRTDWEGFYTATRAAAKGGVTTIADMPLNAIPPTTTVDNFNQKLVAAKNQIFVDVAFWGGLIRDNHEDLKGLVHAGVVGFKCFLCPSGVDEFPNVDEKQVESAMKILEETNSLLAFHAEMEIEQSIIEDDPQIYSTFLNSRPSSMEIKAIKKITSLCNKYKVRCHIVHLSAAEALPIIREYKSKHKNLTVETCHHYLTLTAETIPNGSTQFKCCPPIRNEKNRELLWEAVKTGDIDLVVSDHSPCTPDLKFLAGDGDNAKRNFLKAWGGISSLQFGLSLFWTGAKNRGFTLSDLTRILSANPAQLCGLQKQKGALKEGFDADFVVWNPDEAWTLKQSDIEHKNKITPYVGMNLCGKVYQTIVRGQVVYNLKTGLSSKPLGCLIQHLQ